MHVIPQDLACLGLNLHHRVVLAHDVAAPSLLARSPEPRTNSHRPHGFATRPNVLVGGRVRPFMRNPAAKRASQETNGKLDRNSRLAEIRADAVDRGTH